MDNVLSISSGFFCNPGRKYNKPCLSCVMLRTMPCDTLTFVIQFQAQFEVYVSKTSHSFEADCNKP